MNRQPNKAERGEMRGERTALHPSSYILHPFAQSPIPNPSWRSRAPGATAGLSSSAGFRGLLAPGYYSPLSTRHSLPRPAFTLVELLVTITIIGILAGMMFGGLQLARESAREQATKATIAKLNNIIMRRYESYMTRRVPLDLSKTSTGTAMGLHEQAEDRLYAIRDIMRMEMPDRSGDINDNPITLPNSQKQMQRPALSQMYKYKLDNSPPSGGNNGAAELLYLIVSMGSPEAMEQFNTSEIGDTDSNGWPEFLDGWGRPIWFLRWAPGYSNYSDIQIADADKHHDPFDPRRTETAYQLFPLIYSSGTDNDPGLSIQPDYHYGVSNPIGAIFSNTVFTEIGTPLSGHGKGLITNHHIEQR